MRIEKDVNIPITKTGRKKFTSKYYQFLINFICDNNCSNMCITFDTEKEMKTFYGGLRVTQRRYKLNAIDFKTKENKLYLIKRNTMEE